MPSGTADLQKKVEIQGGVLERQETMTKPIQSVSFVGLLDLCGGSGAKAPPLAARPGVHGARGSVRLPELPRAIQLLSIDYFKYITPDGARQLRTSPPCAVVNQVNNR